MRRPFRALITQLRSTALGPLKVVRSRDLASTPDEGEGEGEGEPIINAFNQLEQHLDGLRDAGHRLALVSASLRSSAREMAVSVERLETPAKSHAPVPQTAVPSIPAEERRAHLRLLKTVA